MQALARLQQACARLGLCSIKLQNARSTESVLIFPYLSAHACEAAVKQACWCVALCSVKLGQHSEWARCTVHRKVQKPAGLSLNRLVCPSPCAASYVRV